MGNAEQLLVVILSVVLAAFLLVGIIALVKIIELVNDLKRITEKAEKLADKAESVGEFFAHAAGPAAIVKIMANVVSTVFKNKKGKGQKQ